jgi:hypothetical protein
MCGIVVRVEPLVAGATLTIGKGGVLSEFYAQRRTSIKDGVALLAFIGGWFAAAPYAWPYISRGFDDGGNAARGVFVFLVIVFIAGVVSGLLGLLLGGAIGAAWERYHRRRRGPADADRDTTEETSARAGVKAARVQRSTGSVLSPRFEMAVEPSDYVGLLRLLSSELPDLERRRRRSRGPRTSRRGMTGCWSASRASSPTDISTPHSRTSLCTRTTSGVAWGDS